MRDDIRRRTQAMNDATYAAWNAHDPDAVAAVFAEDAVVREIGAGESRGRDAVQRNSGSAARPRAAISAPPR